MATKESIGQRLAGLPSHIQRGLHELFHHLYEEVEQLRAEVRALTGDTEPEAPTTETGDVATERKPDAVATTETPDEPTTADGGDEAPTTETGDHA